MSYQHIFIDLDDTLWDTYGNIKETLWEQFHKYRMDKCYKSFEDFYSIFWPHNESLWARYRRNEIKREDFMIARFKDFVAPIGITEKKDIIAFNSEFLQRTTTKHKLVDGAVDLLEHLSKKNYTLSILSNGFREVQEQKMQHSGIRAYFAHIILSDDAKALKPSTQIFDYARGIVNSRSSDCIMIGDSWEADIVGAKNAGIDQIWFNPKAEKTEDFIPTYEAASLAEIMNII